MAEYKSGDFITVAMWMVGALTSTSMMAVSIREIGPGLSPFQILFIRSFIGLVVVATMIRLSGRTQQFFTNQPKLHFARSFFHFCGQYGWITGLTLLPLAEVFAIEFTAPIWTIILAAAFLNERITPAKVGSIFLAIVGVFIIVKPGDEIINPASLLVLATAVFFAASYVVTKLLAYTESPLTVLLYMSAVQCFLGFVFGIAGWVQPALSQWLWILALALAGLAAHYSITKALQIADTSMVVTIDLLRLPLISLVGIIVYGEYGTITLFVGGLLILVGNALNIYTNLPERNKTI